MTGIQDNVNVTMRIGRDDTAFDDPDVDVTDHVASIRIDRGRERETDSYRPGTAEIVLNDTDRRFDPRHKERFGWIDFEEVLGSGPTDSTPDAAKLDITGDIAVVVRLHALQAGSIGHRVLMSKWTTETDDRSWQLRIDDSSDTLVWEWSTDGTDLTLEQAESDPITDVFGKDDVWIAVSHDVDVDDGVGSNDNVVLFWTSMDGDDWALHSAVKDFGTTNIFSGSANMRVSGEVGGTGAVIGAMHSGGVVEARVYDGISGFGVPDGGTLVAHRRYIDADEQTTPHVAPTGETWTLNGTDWSFSDNGGTPYGTRLTPKRRVSIDHGGNEMFVGFVEDWEVDYEEGDELSRVTVSCSDVLGVLARAELDEISAAHAGDTSGERINRVLALDEVNLSSSIPTSIDTGLATLGATTFGENALNYLQTVARSESGQLFASRDGTLTFWDRHKPINSSASQIWDFFDEHAASSDSDSRYMSATQLSAQDLLRNRITASSEATGNQQTVADTSSRDEYHTSTLPLGELFLATDEAVNDIITYLLQRFSQPEERIDEVTFNANSAAGFAFLAGLFDIGDLARVHRQPLGIGDVIDQNVIIDGIRHQITPGHWTITFRLSDQDTRSFLTLDDSELGMLNENRLAY